MPQFTCKIQASALVVFFDLLYYNDKNSSNPNAASRWRPAFGTDKAEL